MEWNAINCRPTSTAQEPSEMAMAGVILVFRHLATALYLEAAKLNQSSSTRRICIKPKQREELLSVKGFASPALFLSLFVLRLRTFCSTVLKMSCASVCMTHKKMLE